MKTYEELLNDHSKLQDDCIKQLKEQVTLLKEKKELLKALDNILNKDYGSGCPMCDNGKLRDPKKEHWDDCNWNNARIIYNKFKS